MPLFCYKEVKIRHENIVLISRINRIIDDYKAQGFSMTLRQLFYQLVTQNVIENSIRSYKSLGSVVNDGRLAGYIDWNSIVDHTRQLASLSHWENPGVLLSDAASQFAIDKWGNQKLRVEVWIEKEALANVAEYACTPYDVPFFCCRGYTSQSEMWRAAQRIVRYLRDDDQPVLIIHLGDHDPSGRDMTRDIIERLEMFVEAHTSTERLEVDRIALNMNQVKERDLPPNPTKITDSRAAKYIESFGDEQWELDAISVRELVLMIQARVKKVIDEKQWKKDVSYESSCSESLKTLSRNWAKTKRILDRISE